jgi:glucose/mannose-6-phosphate isomerase
MAGTLDDPAVLAQFDASGMAARVGELGSQLREGWAHTRRVTLPPAYREATSIALLGMGGSAIAGDLVRGIFADRLSVPLVVVRDYTLPAFSGPSTLVVASSHSGATEETIAATNEALARGCPLAVITTGGPLAELADRDALPLLRFEPEPQPRLAVGWGVALLAGLLERAGLLAAGEGAIDAEFADAASRADRRFALCAASVPTEGNPAKQLAWTLLDRIPVVIGAGHLVPVARRWKTQFNENAKSWAAWDELPEATHNTIAGLAEPEIAGEHLFGVFLASPDDHPRTRLRRNAFAALLDAVGTPHAEVGVEGAGALAQAFDGIVLGDLASVYLAVLYGIDPTPVAAIQVLKERMAGA